MSFYRLWVIAILFSVVSTLPNLTPIEVSNLVKESCVILLLEPVPTAIFQAISQLNSLFLDKILPVGISSVEKFEAESLIHLKLSPSGNGLALVVEKKPDRTCLLTDLLVHTHLKAILYTGPGNLDLILSFINVHCNTFFTINGSLSQTGLHRQSILQNLYKVTDAVNFGKLAQSCSNLKNFFKTGTCSNQNYCQSQNLVTPTLYRPSLPRCETLDRLPSREEFFSNYLSRGKPVIFKNVLQNWPAYQKWTNDFFRKNYGKYQLHIKLTPSVGDFEGVEPISWWNTSNLSIPEKVIKQIPYPHLVVVRPDGQEMRMEEFLDLIEKKAENSSRISAYLEYAPIRDYMKGLEKDIIEPEFMKGLLNLDLLNIWFSDGNTLGKLHMDFSDNLLCQLRGRKQVILFEPWNNTNLYESHILESMFRYENGTFYRDKMLEATAISMSPVDISSPDFEKFPLFAHTYPLNCTINEGDVLYLPSFWWHEVQSFPNLEEKRNLAVNFWYQPFLTKEVPCASCKFDVNSIYRHLL